MELTELYTNAKAKMEKCMTSLERDFSAVRAGRANPAVLDKVMVDYYGVPTPVNQMAAISVPEARMLVIQPWDASTLKEIEKAINTSDIGINPQNDGKVIRLAFPQLTEEHRRELTKDISKRGEEAKVAIRNVRRDFMDELKKMKKNSEITEDDLRDGEEQLQKITDDYVKEAYSERRWAFVSDYARFWILYNYGGLYFDTDVEVIKRADSIIEKGSFMGNEYGKDPNTTLVNPGLGMGAEKGLR